VPNNDTDLLAQDWARGDPLRKTPEALRTGKTVRPWVIEGSDQAEAVVHYLWRLADGGGPEDSPHIDTLCRMAHMVRALGWGIDHVIGSGRVLGEEEADGLAGMRYVPASDEASGAMQLRVPVPGFYDELRAAYRAFCRRIGRESLDTSTAATGYGLMSYRPALAAEPRHFAAFELRDEHGRFRSVRWQETMLAAAWLRHAAGEYLKQVEGYPQEWIDSYVLGHGTGDARGQRLSYVPLPTIGHAHADGRVRRALVVQPSGEPRTVSTVLAWGLTGTSLTDEHGEARAWLAGTEPDSVLQRYTATSDTWLTVTPLILHGHDRVRGKFMPGKAERLILQAFEVSGYKGTMLEEIWYQRAPLWRGAGDARLCRVPSHLAPWPRYHVGVRFQVPMPGPVLAGIGRHYGLGVFAAS
jgi:CRISPR-associated protein Csb2